MFAVERGYDAEAQIIGMEMEGIDIAVLFPTAGLSFLARDDMDPQFSNAICRAYNDWLHDFVQHSPDQLKMVAMLPVYDVNLACRELHRCVKEYGAVGARNFLDELAKIDFISITNVIIDKRRKPSTYDVFSNAWQILFQRFENTMKYKNFPGHYQRDFGIVINDNTEGMKLQKLVRKMAVYNPIPHIVSMYGAGYRIMPIQKIIEDPNSRDSKYSYLIQGCDVVAYFLLQRFAPNSYIRRVGAQHYFDRLAPVLNTRASRSDPLGIVVL